MSARSSRSGSRGVRPLLAASVVVWLVSPAVHAGSSPALPGQDPASRPLTLPEGGGSAIARGRCLACHGADMLLQQRLSRAGWDRELGKMIGWGAAVEDAERQPLLDYLAAHMGPVPPSRLPAAAEDAGAAIVRTRCVACHGTAMIEQQRLTAAGWAREVDKMRNWGAAVTDEEKDPLIEYLASAPWNAGG